jgi:hypothetical protein
MSLMCALPRPSSPFLLLIAKAAPIYLVSRHAFCKVFICNLRCLFTIVDCFVVVPPPTFFHLTQNYFPYDGSPLSVEKFYRERLRKKSGILLKESKGKHISELNDFECERRREYEKRRDGGCITALTALLLPVNESVLYQFHVFVLQYTYSWCIIVQLFYAWLKWIRLYYNQHVIKAARRNY